MQVPFHLGKGGNALVNPTKAEYSSSTETESLGAGIEGLDSAIARLNYSNHAHNLNISALCHHHNFPHSF